MGKISCFIMAELSFGHDWKRSFLSGTEFQRLKEKYTAKKIHKHLIYFGWLITGLRPLIQPQKKNFTICQFLEI